MKKPLIITIVILIVILILPAASFLGWYFKEKKPMNIVILDKTVHSLERTSHRSLTWVLANNRIVKRDNNRKYLLRKDYYGFYPLKPLRSKQFRKNDLRLADLLDLANNNDVLYYADTYGVFFNDWYQGINRSRRSRKLYGGLNNNDYLFLSEMKKRQKLVILEYNTFGYPTDAYEKYRVEEQFGMESTGWMGQYYESLSIEAVPEWLVAMYTKKNREDWNFESAGVVFLKGENDIIVLEEGKHLVSALPFIETGEDMVLKYSVAPKVSYLGPFDVVNPKENSVISNFKLETTPEGMQILDNHFLSNTFPAVIGGLEDVNHIYLCGDFASGKLSPWSACFGSLKKFSSLLYSDEDNDPDRFFWLYYRPLLSGLLNNYYLTLDN